MTYLTFPYLVPRWVDLIITFVVNKGLVEKSEKVSIFVQISLEPMKDGYNDIFITLLHRQPLVRTL